MPHGTARSAAEDDLAADGLARVVQVPAADCGLLDPRAGVADVDPDHREAPVAERGDRRQPPPVPRRQVDPQLPAVAPAVGAEALAADRLQGLGGAGHVMAPHHQEAAIPCHGDRPLVLLAVVRRIGDQLAVGHRRECGERQEEQRRPSGDRTRAARVPTV